MKLYEDIEDQLKERKKKLEDDQVLKGQKVANEKQEKIKKIEEEKKKLEELKKQQAMFQGSDDSDEKEDEDEDFDFNDINQPNQGYTK